ncbi:PREDICTED: auxin efflux carrier component 5-like [Nicotiana attenuata]|uniref:Auxin efflux carrier component n=1 Tax=Nicotiana attenuata TaxID=49451 RepID=A0A1J6J639_NICAT|nr:PREDICTED: auxin efflux carrier component 5-like [Nicotiana attenuata]OIT08128.1 auxin efflux carrier component 5 [Nicotiana attenuata]
MIEWEDIYKVVAAMAPLYVALILGYGSVKWWHMFKSEQCDAINRFNCFFIIPFFNFEFIANFDPYNVNGLFLSGDVISKALLIVILVLWANFYKKGNFSWSITTFSLSTLNNTLVVGVPLMKAMYGKLGVDLVIQAAVIQALLWLTSLLFALEFWKTKMNSNGNSVELASISDLEGNNTSVNPVRNNTNNGLAFRPLIKAVSIKLAKNPNTYACFLGLIWALLANRWNFEMPIIIEGSFLIMSKAGSGVAMFSMGLFMALQGKIVACGAALTIYAMILRFVVGPATMALGCVVLGLHGNVLRVAIIQSALPQAITSFVYAQEYGLHADVLSTAVIVGTIISLPLLIAYYAVLDIMH